VSAIEAYSAGPISEKLKRAISSNADTRRMIRILLSNPRIRNPSSTETEAGCLRFRTLDSGEVIATLDLEALSDEAVEDCQ